MSPARAVTVCLLIAGFVVGGLLALVTAFFLPTRLGGVVSVGVVLTVLSIGPYSHAVGRAVRSAPAAAVPAIGWFVVTMTLATKRAEGDLVVPGTVGGIAFLLLGTVSATVGIGTVRAGINRAERRRLARTVQAEDSAADT